MRQTEVENKLNEFEKRISFLESRVDHSFERKPIKEEEPIKEKKELKKEKEEENDRSNSTESDSE